MNPFSHTGLSISDSLKSVRKSVLIYETIIHELGHIILHRKQLKLAPMKDDVLYTMTNSTEYEANLFAADLLVEDDDVAEMSKNEDLDYFGFCSNLNVSPDLMSFKLYSLMKRGHAYHMPMEIQSNFLAK